MKRRRLVANWCNLSASRRRSIVCRFGKDFSPKRLRVLRIDTRPPSHLPYRQPENPRHTPNSFSGCPIPHHKETHHDRLPNRPQPRQPTHPPAFPTRQPPRLNRRRNRHGQNRNPAQTRRSVQPRRRTRVYGGCERRPFRHLPRRQKRRQGCRTHRPIPAARRLSARLPRALLGCLRRNRHPRAREHFRHGRDAAGAPDEPKRHARRRVKPCV